MKKLIAILAIAGFVAAASAHCGKCDASGKDKDAKEKSKCSETCSKEKSKKCTDAEKEKCAEKKAEEKK